MKTRTFFLFLTVLLLLALPAVGATVVWIQPPSQTQVQDGQTVSINVDIANVTDLYGYQFSIDYNDALLAPTAVTEGPFLATGGPTFFYTDFSDDTYTPGEIDIFDSLYLFGPGVTEGATPATLVSLQFLVLPGNGVSPITFDDQSFLNSVSQDLTSGIAFNPGLISTPEPATYGVAGSALIGLAWLLRKKVRR